MNKKILILRCLWSLIILTILTTNRLAAYDIPTHQSITNRAANISSLNKYLQTRLGFKEGTQEIILGLTVQDRVGQGSRSEDVPGFRVLNHFHNPLQPWAQAGLGDYIFGVIPIFGQSSVLWSQNLNQSPGGKWSWSDARRQYNDALTKSSKSERDQSFADLFRSLGQLTHLVQDAQVYDPAALDAVLLILWNDMKDALRNGDITGVAHQIVSESRDKYVEAFQIIEAQLPNVDQILTNYIVRSDGRKFGNLRDGKNGSGTSNIFRSSVCKGFRWNMEA
jgi:hypothetical protein